MYSKFSLILCTLNRTVEVDRFLSSLLQQTLRNFEVIIVDQNIDNRLDKIIKRYESDILIKHVKINVKGLSYARNVGIKIANGDILGFPDDDCYYPNELLEGINELFEKQSIGALSVAWKDFEGKKVSHFGNKKIKINILTVWTHVSSITLFVKKDVLDKVGLFDESLGVGEYTQWKGAEDKDLPIRIIKNGYKLVYDPKLYVIHERPLEVDVSTLSIEQIHELKRKTYNYSSAVGYVMKKHRLPYFVYLSSVIVIIIKLIINMFFGDRFIVDMKTISLFGRIDGYHLRYRPDRFIR